MLGNGHVLVLRGARHSNVPGFPGLFGTDDSLGAGFRNAWASSTRGAKAGDAVQIAQTQQSGQDCWISMKATLGSALPYR